MKINLKKSTELENVLLKNPFLKKQKTKSDSIYVTFLAEKPSSIKIKMLKEINFNPEEYFIDAKTIYIFLPNGYGKAKLTNNFFESKLSIPATTRNWKTVKKIFELSKK